MKKLYFIRHGLSEGNKANIWSGRTETPLSEEGRAQARATANQVKSLNIHLIVSSPMGRAKETAEIIANDIGYPKKKIIYSDLLIERSFGDLEGRPHQETDTLLDLDTVPNVETKDMILARADKAIKFLESLPDENILVVSHGSFGRALRHHLIESMPFHNHKSSSKDVLPNGEVICWI
jgi:broad specificity phosphatase PhoE